MVEYGQIVDYATAITKHPQVADTPHRWDFWLIGTDLDPSIRSLWTNAEHEPGLALKQERFRVWVLTWGMLLDRETRRLNTLRDRLDVRSSHDSAREFLQRKHAEYIPAMS